MGSSFGVVCVAFVVFVAIKNPLFGDLLFDNTGEGVIPVSVFVYYDSCNAL